MTTVSAQSWHDVTDLFIVNPRFDNNDRATGWQGTPFGAYNPKENAEHYQMTFDSYQEIKGLQPNTKYRLSLDAFYRYGSYTNDYNAYKTGNYAEYQHARLYAQSGNKYYDTGIKLLGSGARTSSLGGGTVSIRDGWTTYYVPNNMESAYYWFDNGYYDNLIEFTSGSDGTARIGVKKDVWVGEDWLCLDNWKLEFYGNVVNVSSIKLSDSSLNLVIGEEKQLTYTILPDNATYKKVTWTSSNQKVAKVDADGVVTAVGQGSATITACSTDGKNTKSTCSITVKASTPTAENIIINEIMAANVDVYRDPSTNFGSWVELYNPTDAAVSLGNLYISDDLANLKKHHLSPTYGAIPAKGFAVLHFDHFEVWTKKSLKQIDDKLDCDGGTIIISDGKNIIAQKDYPQAISRVAYARTTDGGAEWGTTANPTPGKSNASSTFASVQLDAPVVDTPGGLFQGSKQIFVDIPEGATLRYTTDGSAPTLSNGNTSSSGLFKVSNTTIYRFRLFKDGYLPSPVVTRSYIYKDKDYVFPIVSVVSAEENFTSPEYGVRTQGINGRPGNGQQGNCNWNMDWDRPVNFEYITKDGEYVISQECDYKVCGGWSRGSNFWTNMGGASFKLSAGKEYELKNYFDYQFFDDKKFLKHKTLQVRQGGNDNGCRIKDAAIQEVVRSSGLYIESQAWQPVHHFINGEYKGVINVREPNNKHYGYANYGIDTDLMDQFEVCPDSGYVQMEGTKEKFDEWYTLSKTASNNDSYEKIKQIVDIDEYINYMAVELYVANWDWPQNNMKAFRDRDNGRFRFVLFDLDGALNSGNPLTTFEYKQNYTFDNLYGYNYATGTSITNTRLTKEIEPVTIFLNMLENAEFRRQFIDAYCIVAGSVFEPNRVNRIISDCATYMESGMRLDNNASPWGTANSLINGFSNRESTLVDYLASYHRMQLYDAQKVSTSLSTNIPEGRIFLNDQLIPTGKMTGHTFLPATLKAVAPAGYYFAGWTPVNGSNSNVTNKIFENGSEWDYYDGGSLDGENWTSTSYSTNKWSNGKAPIGYGKNQSTTTTGYLPTYYFRKRFTLAQAPAADAEISLNYTLDDGMVLYLNGEEIARDNMPSGTVTYNTLATSYAYNNPNTGSLIIPASKFKKGTNVFAVEVHNNATNSSDILWAAELVVKQDAEPDYEFVSTDKEYKIPETNSCKLIAVFKPFSEEQIAESGIAPIVINEVSASNSMYVNDYYKKNDWLELYNTTDEDIDIAGLYISDNASKPQKYQVPLNDLNINTIIPARGYKVIWCDKLENFCADIHTSFKLGAEGADVLVSKYDGKTLLWSDELTYVPHLGSESFGRFPDASRNTYVMNKPTIGKSNMLTSYDTLYGSSTDPDATSIDSVIRNGNMSMKYVDGAINVKSESNITSLRIYSTTGMEVKPVSIRTTSNFTSAYLGSLPSGIYVAYATDNNNNECKLKFLVKE